jgi:hypothetical protein
MITISHLKFTTRVKISQPVDWLELNKVVCLCCGLGHKPRLEAKVHARNSKRKEKKGGKYTDARSMGKARCFVQPEVIKR